MFASYYYYFREGLKFNMVNIGGVDIHNGEKKLVLATMWQIIMKHTMNVYFLTKDDW